MLPVARTSGGQSPHAGHRPRAGAGDAASPWSRRASSTSTSPGRAHAFDLPLGLDGTDFQRRVWAALAAIPYGETISYGELARASAQPGAPPAPSAWPTAATRSRSSSPATGSSAPPGSLTGYGGGLPRKRQLLDLERQRRVAKSLGRPLCAT